MAHKTQLNQIEILGFVLILVNILVFLYFILKLEQIETLTQTTSAQAQTIIEALNYQSK